MVKNNFNLDSQPDFNEGFVQVDENRTDFADLSLGEERLFQIPSDKVRLKMSNLALTGRIEMVQDQ